MSSWSTLLLSLALVLLAVPFVYRLLWLRRFGAPAVGLLRLRGRVLGPGERGTVVCMGEPSTNSGRFELEVAGKSGPERVLVETVGRFCVVRGGIARNRHRLVLGAVRVGDRVTVDGTPTDVWDNGRLFREPPLRRALAVLRIARGAWPERRAGSLLLMGAGLAALACAVALHAAGKHQAAASRYAVGARLDVGDAGGPPRQITLDVAQIPGPQPAVQVTFGNPGTRPLTLDVPRDGIGDADLLEPLISIEAIDDQGRRLKHASRIGCGGVYRYSKVEPVTLPPGAQVSRTLNLPHLYYPPWATVPEHGLAAFGKPLQPPPPAEPRFHLRVYYDTRHLHGSWREDLRSGSRPDARIIRGASAPTIYVVPKSLLPAPRLWWRTKHNVEPLLTERGPGGSFHRADPAGK
jgi:hypothetical protein